MSFFITLICMILILSIIVFIHEGGHFFFAKKAGIYVYEFSIGMGPRIFKFKRKNDETEYSIRLLPIGGYVQMAGEEVEMDKKIPEKMRMQSKTWGQKFMTIIAGIMMNFILAIVVFFIVGLVNGAGQNKPYISQVDDNVRGVEVGDKIISVNGKKVVFTDVFVLDIQINKDKPLDLELKGTDGNIKKVTLTPVDGKYGIGLSDEVKTGFIPAVCYAFVKFVSLFYQMLLVIWYLIIGKLGLSSLSGPVGIFTVVGESANAGIINLIYLMGFISLNVGFMNLLPIPALDGGRILFLIIEKFKGKPVDTKVENIIHTAGFVILMGLMVLVTISDIVKLFH